MERLGRLAVARAVNKAMQREERLAGTQTEFQTSADVARIHIRWAHEAAREIASPRERGWAFVA